MDKSRDVQLDGISQRDILSGMSYTQDMVKQ